MAEPNAVALPPGCSANSVMGPIWEPPRHLLRQQVLWASAVASLLKVGGIEDQVFCSYLSTHPGRLLDAIPSSNGDCSGDLTKVT